MQQVKLSVFVTGVALGIRCGWGLGMWNRTLATAIVLGDRHAETVACGTFAQAASPFAALGVSSSPSPAAENTTVTVPQSTTPDLSSRTSPAPANDHRNKEMLLSWEEWFNKAASLKGDSTDVEKWAELQGSVNRNPVLRHELMRRYDTERDERTKNLLKEALAASGTPDVVDFLRTLAASGDAAKRRDGFELLIGRPASAEGYQLAKDALGKEQDPSVLSRAIAALQPPIRAAPAETRAVAAQLASLAQHQDPAVRSESLQMLAQWDVAGEELNKLAYQALSDTSPEVRQAALAAVTSGGLRSENLKAGLIGILSNASESVNMRAGALQALERFALSNDEYAVYKQAHVEMDQLNQGTPR